MNNDFMAIFNSPAAGASGNAFFAAAASKSPDEPAGPSFADVLADSADEAGLRETGGDGTPDVRAESAPEPPASEEAYRSDGGDKVLDLPISSAVSAPDAKVDNQDRRFLLSSRNQSTEALSRAAETGVQAGKRQGPKITNNEARAYSKEGKAAKPEGQVKTAIESADSRLHIASREIRPANEVSSHAASGVNSAGATEAAGSNAAESIGRQTQKGKSSTADGGHPATDPAARKKAANVTAAHAEYQKPVGEKTEVSAHPQITPTKSAAAGISEGSGDDKTAASVSRLRQQGQQKADAASGGPLMRAEDQKPVADKTEASAYPQITPTKSADAGISEGSGDEKMATLVSRLRQQGQQNVDATGAGAPARVGSTSAGAEGTSLEQTWTGRTADVPADVLRQVTDRIGAQLRSGASEMRLALKPESLGHLNLSISTDQNGVSVRIVAETAAARDLIETQLGQLRNDLAQQGLDVKALEVGVFTANDDSRRDAQGQPYSGRSGSARLTKEPQNDVAAVSPAVVQRWEDGRQRLVGIYA